MYIQFCTSEKLSTLLHINPPAKLFGILGLTPKYRFGLYVPHNMLSLNCLAVSWANIEGAPSAFTTAPPTAARARCENFMAVKIYRSRVGIC